MRTPGFRETVQIGPMTRSLRFKATVAVVSFLVLISGLLSAVFLMYLEREQRRGVRALADEWSSLLAEAVAEGVESGEPARFDGMLRAIGRDPRVLYLSVHGATGELASRMDRCPPPLRERLMREAPSDGFFRTARSNAAELANGEGTVLDLVVPVHAAPNGAAGDATREAIGSVRFGFDLTSSRRRLLDLRAHILASAIAMIVFGSLGTMFLVGTIVSPIQELARATKRISDGDFDVRMEVESGDEVGVLTHSFNHMVERLNRAQERQRTWSRELEERVHEKTREIDETREHLSNIVENVGDSILVADLDGTIISANTHTMDIFGTKPEWVVGRALDEFTCDPGRTLETLRPALEATKSPRVYEARHHAVGPEGGDLLITHTLLRDSRGEPGGILQITKDVTALKRMESRLVTTERLSAMGEMAGEIGHELNNYLMAIGGRAELVLLALARGTDAHHLDRVRDSAEIICRQVSEMRALTDGLMESARKETRPTELDLNELVRSTIDFVRPQNKYDRLSFAVRLTDDPLPVFADAQQIRQVLLNLISNAAEATLERLPDGGTLRVETFRTSDRVGFRVTDEGTGIDQETMPRVFEPHFTTKEHGHGFGLAVCHRVVTNHGGSIVVDSVPGAGTTFTVRLDLRTSSTGAAERVASR